MNIKNYTKNQALIQPVPTGAESLALQREAIAAHGLRPEDDGKVLVVDDVLPHGAHDPARFLVQTPPTPVWVHAVQVRLHVVMATQEDHVQARQRHVLVHTLITCAM